MERSGRRGEPGFSLIEVLVAMAVMMIVTAAVFMLLSQSQTRYITTSSVEDVTAMLRDGVDQMVREIRLAGYPPPNSFPCPPLPGATYVDCRDYLNSGYVAGGVLVANAYAIQFEADTDGDNLAEVLDYELQVPAGAAAGGCAGLTENAALRSPTLMRSVAVKDADGTVPAAELQPFLENVRNCELAQPIFAYCRPAPPAAPAGCPTMTNYLPSTLTPDERKTRIVLIRLQVQAPQQDPETGQFHNIEHFALAERVNPD